LSNTKSDFEHSLHDLHDGAGRINKSLEDIVNVIDQVARDNESFIQTMDKEPDSEHSADIRKLLENVRDQIKDIVDFGRKFEVRINEYSDEIVDLNRQLEQTKQIAMIDPTTGIGNRRRFEESLKTIIENIEDFKGKVSVLLADVDNFKTINDTLGHNVGDQVLRQVAQNFVTNLKGSDIVARWGGDEFSAILPETELVHAIKVAENVREGIAKRSIRNKETGEEMGRVTLSIGVSSYHEGDNPHKLIFRADQALYEAKRAGRNRTQGELDDDD